MILDYLDAHRRDTPLVISQHNVIASTRDQQRARGSAYALNSHGGLVQLE